jgi:flagellar biosynthetic protein FliP
MTSFLHSPAGHFVRHYLEMVVAMLLGMAALGIAQALGLDLGDDTTVELVEMCVWMTVPMVAWMRYRHGHSWRVCNEMAAAMVIPTIGALVLHWAGAVDDGHALLMLEHTVMFPAMLVPMLLRRDGYTAPDHDHATGTAILPKTAG